MGIEEARDTKDCPFCGETIKAVAIKCRFCHSDLAADATTRTSDPKPPTKPCPFCGELIGADAAKCSFCDTELTGSGVAQLPGVKSSTTTQNAPRSAETEALLRDAVAARDLIRRTMQNLKQRGAYSYKPSRAVTYVGLDHTSNVMRAMSSLFRWWPSLAENLEDRADTVRDKPKYESYLRALQPFEESCESIILDIELGESINLKTAKEVIESLKGLDEYRLIRELEVAGEKDELDGDETELLDKLRKENEAKRERLRRQSTDGR